MRERDVGVFVVGFLFVLLLLLFFYFFFFFFFFFCLFVVVFWRGERGERQTDRHYREWEKSHRLNNLRPIL